MLRSFKENGLLCFFLIAILSLTSTPLWAESASAPSRPAFSSSSAIAFNSSELTLERGQVKIINEALSQLGVRYRSGSRHPNKGFDCSGLISWVFQAAGITLPRTAGGQYASAGVNVGKDYLQPGDLVFFKRKKRIYHVGIYLYDGKFIHSATGPKKVTISDLNKTPWRQHFVGARRVRTMPPGETG